MMVLMHFDWAGTMKGLEDLTEQWKKHAEKTKGVEFKGRLAPWNKKYHWTMILKMDNVACLHEWQSTWSIDRDYGKMSHGVWDFYS